MSSQFLNGFVRIVRSLCDKISFGVNTVIPSDGSKKQLWPTGWRSGFTRPSPWFKTRRVRCTELLTYCHHTSIKTLSVHRTYGRSGKDFSVGSNSKHYDGYTYSFGFPSDVPDEWIAQQIYPVSYTVNGWSVMSCVLSMLYLNVAAHWSKYQCYNQALSRYDLRC